MMTTRPSPTSWTPPESPTESSPERSASPELPTFRDSSFWPPLSDSPFYTPTFAPEHIWKSPEPNLIKRPTIVKKRATLMSTDHSPTTLESAQTLMNLKNGFPHSPPVRRSARLLARSPVSSSDIDHPSWPLPSIYPKAVT